MAAGGARRGWGGLGNYAVSRSGVCSFPPLSAVSCQECPRVLRDRGQGLSGGLAPPGGRPPLARLVWWPPRCPASPPASGPGPRPPRGRAPTPPRTRPPSNLMLEVLRLTRLLSSPFLVKIQDMIASTILWYSITLWSKNV